MSNIIIPGQKKEFQRKQSELSDVAKQEKYKIDDEIDILIKQSKTAGYDSIKDYVKATFDYWTVDTDKAIIKEMYSKFLSMVQQGASKKPWAEGIWDQNSEFEEYLKYSEIETISRLEELEWKKRTKFPAYQGMEKMLPDMTNVPKGVGESLSAEDYDFYQLVLRKSLELIKLVRGNEIILNQYLEE